MALTPAEIANSPIISLGGRDFHIPPLAVKQNRVVVGGLKTIMPMLAAFEKFAVEAKAAAADGKIDSAEAGFAMLASFPVEDGAFDALASIVYAALTRAYPSLSKAEFDDMPLGVDELLMAVPVIMAQSFAFARRGGAQPEQPGEAKPAPAAVPEAVQAA